MRLKKNRILLSWIRPGTDSSGALQKIIRYGVERLVYISCKPTSLVRDLEVFLGNGYAVRRAVAVDQFPWTSGIETVVMMERCGLSGKNQNKLQDVTGEN